MHPGLETLSCHASVSLSPPHCEVHFCCPTIRVMRCLTHFICTTGEAGYAGWLSNRQSPSVKQQNQPTQVAVIIVTH